MDTTSVTEQINGLLCDYVHCIDDDRLEEWANFFVDDCVYKAFPRENVDQNLPLAVIDCEGKGQLRDRVVILRNATVFSLRLNRHILSNVRVVSEDNGIYRAQANFVVFVTDLVDGVTQVFSAGRYDDKVVFVDGTPKFKEKIVTFDTYSVPRHISAPL